MTGFFRFLGGTLKIRISGFSRERFLNLCAGKGILLWEVSFFGGVFEGWISVQDFWKLRSIVHKTKVKVAVLEKDGLPFLLPKLRRKWSFLLGAALALTICFLSSFFLWEIKYYGNIQVTEDQMENFLKSYGIKMGRPLTSLNLSFLEKEIRRNFPQIVWTSLKQDGTNLIVDVKENELESPDSREDGITNEELSREGELNLYSNYEGTIVTMIVRKGIPKVKIGDQVEKGQLLVEGAVPIYAEDGTIKDYLTEKADADIFLEHKLQFEESQSVTYEENTFMGRYKKSLFLKYGDKKVLFQLGKKFYKETFIITENQPWLFQKLEIPIWIGEIRHSEYLIFRKKHTEEEMRMLLSKKMMKFLESLDEKGVQIIEKNVKIYDEGDNWHLYVDFLVIERVCQ